MRGLYWLRNDLRLDDNKALTAFCEECSEGLILWSATESYLRSKKFRKSFIHNSLLAHRNQLETVGQQLHASSSNIFLFLKDILIENKISKIYFTLGISIEEKREEAQVKDICDSLGVSLQGFNGHCLIDAEQLPFSIAHMPLVFTDYRKKIELCIESKDIISKPLECPKMYPKPIVLNCDHSSFHFLNGADQAPLLFSGGEKNALERLNSYLFNGRNILSYKETRNGMIEFDDSTKFSPWLSVGALSAKRVFFELKKFESNVESNSSTYWLFFELLWRDYFKHFSLKYQNSLFKLTGISQKPLSKSNLTESQIKSNFEKWKSGKTSKDFVNANMLELAQTGWMSNRGRQNVASFLIHDLEVPWTWGASYFEEMLIDYDCESNWGNWLYLSGRGSDPRSRVFNIDKQANDYDASGAYRKRWLK